MISNPLEDVEALEELAESNGALVTHRYRFALFGFAAEMTEEAIDALEGDRRVASIEPDGLVTAAGSQSSAPWHLDDIDDTDDDSTYDYTSDGTGVTIYVMDTGVRSTHNELTGRVSAGYNAFSGTTEDCNGHGTWVAGIAAGTTYGVAKDADVVAVRTLPCSGSGTMANFIAGADWIAMTASQPSVVNISGLIFSHSSAVDAAINALLNNGLVVVASIEDCTCSHSAANVSGVIGVYGSRTDASTSCPAGCNINACLDFIAPGGSVTGPWYTSNSAVSTGTGPSAATAVVSGGAARWLEGNPTDDSWDVDTALEGYAGSISCGGPTLDVLELPDAL